ncbi:MAG: transposase [Candidatus Aminicenantes bacterium]|nr:transposase [Candidatus Aminicenantes bacterium]
METIIANCLAHGRRKFVTLWDVFPDECRIVIGYLANVYKNESIAKEKSLTPTGRLEFHQRESGPIMEKLKNWLDRQFADKRVEENSSLGKAIRYMQNHWNKLTLFLRVEGAPLDSNLVEQALKLSILNRKNAYFFKTENGARMGDIFMSIIQTCYKAKVNAFEYLVVLQKNAEFVRKEPQNWLPWNFKDTLEKMRR